MVLRKFNQKIISLILSFATLGTICSVSPARALFSISKFLKPQAATTHKSDKSRLNFHNYMIDEFLLIERLSGTQLNDYLKSQITSFEKLSPGLFKIEPDLTQKINHHNLAACMATINKFLKTRPGILSCMIKKHIPLTIGSFEHSTLAGRCSAPCVPSKGVRIQLNSAIYGKDSSLIVNASCTTLHELGHMMENLYFMHTQSDLLTFFTFCPAFFESCATRKATFTQLSKSGDLPTPADYEKKPSHYIASALHCAMQKDKKEGEAILEQIWKMEKSFLEKAEKIICVSTQEKALEKFHQAMLNYSENWGNKHLESETVIAYLNYFSSTAGIYPNLKMAMDRLNVHSAHNKWQILALAKAKYNYSGDGIVSDYGEKNPREWFAEAVMHAFTDKNLDPLCLATIDFCDDIDQQLSA